MNPPILADLRIALDAVLPRVRELRHRLHQYPELQFDLPKTTQLISETLQEERIEVRTGLGQSGVLATMTGGSPAPVVALRADMDALPVEEQTDRPYRSRLPGYSHACGHDGHTAILLGTAMVLRRLRHHLRGAVRWIFQPAEEEGGGARVMLEAGALEQPNVHAIFALHGWPHLPLGVIGLRSGAIMAATDTLHITVIGRGGHAARPYEAVDPILVSARVVEGLQAVASRETNPFDPVVLSICRIEGGTTTNVIPDTCRLAGTLRTLTPGRRTAAQEAVQRIAEATARAHGAQAQVEWHEGYPPTVNHDGCVQYGARVAFNLFGSNGVSWLPYPSMGGEDFAFYLQRVPGAIFRLGLGLDCAPLHHGRFDFPDDALGPGIAFLCALVLEFADARPDRAPSVGPCCG